MFGGFQNGWSSNFSQLSDLSGNFQKIRDGLEAGLQDSGLLGPGEAPQQGTNQQGSVIEKPPTPQYEATKSGRDAVVSQGEASNHADRALPQTEASLLETPTHKSPQESNGDITEPSGWDETTLDLLVPESDANQELDTSAGSLEPTSQHEESSHGGQQLGPPAGDSQPNAPPEGSPPSSVLEGMPLEDIPPEPGSPELQPESSGRSTPAPSEESTLGEQIIQTTVSPVSHTADERIPSDSQPSHTAAQASSDLPDEAQHSVVDTEEAVEPVDDGHVAPGSEVPKLGEDTHPVQVDDTPASASSSLMDADATDVLTSELTKEEGSMEKKDLLALVTSLKDALKTRESQLETKFREVANMQEVTQQLMARNEELARKASKTSEEDVKLLTDEFEARIGAAERKVYALSKERDMLKRNAEKLTSATDLVKEKDNIIAQVMAEGEQLSKKQLAQENTMKKLRQQIKDVELSRKELANETLVVKKQLEETQAVKQRLEEELRAAKVNHKTELDTEVSHYRDLLTKARSAQVEAEERAAVTAKEGLSKKLRDAEQRAEMLQDQISELEMSLERQRAAADAREERLNKEIGDMERRSQEAQSRHDELTGNLPDATRPLLRQIEGMQRTAEAHADAWRAAEESLQLRLADSEARCAAAGEKIRVATEQAQAGGRRANMAAAALDSLREEYASLQLRYDSQDEELRASTSKEQKLRSQIQELQKRVSVLEEELRNSERQYLKRLDSELQGSRKAVLAAEAKASALEEQLNSSNSVTNAPASIPKLGGPPALAGPGHKWILVKNGEEISVKEPKQNGLIAKTASISPQFLGTAAELETLREALQQREDQLASCQATIQQLEATRDSLSEELVSLSQTADQHSRAFNQLQSLQGTYQQAEERLSACTELLGEREERILELTADIEDMKVLYRDQIEFVLGELSGSISPSAAASSVRSWNGGPEN